MNLRQDLNRLIRVVVEEAERNPQFEAALNDALGVASFRRQTSKEDVAGQAEGGAIKRGKNRRAPALLDPIQLISDGVPMLRSALEKLSLDQLRDIVAEYGMDPGRLVMKWATPERVIERIVELSVARAQKGNAFRRPADEVPTTPLGRDGEPPAVKG